MSGRPACHEPALLSTQETERSFKNRSPVRSVPCSKHVRDSQHYKDTPKSLSMTYASRGGLPTSRGGLPPGHGLPHLLSRPLGHAHSSHHGHLPSVRGKEGSSSAPLPSQTQGLENLCPGVQRALSFTIAFKSLHRCHLPGRPSWLPASQATLVPLALSSLLLHFPPPDGMCGPYVLNEMQAPRGVGPVASAHPALAHTQITLLSELARA